jgi:DNA-directed RNA polymerase subunit RPC12/RpoP
MAQIHVCIDCGESVDHLEVFPGPRCLDCWRPIGERQAATMTAIDLARMWGSTS